MQAVRSLGTKQLPLELEVMPANAVFSYTPDELHRRSPSVIGNQLLGRVTTFAAQLYVVQASSRWVPIMDPKCYCPKPPHDGQVACWVLAGSDADSPSARLLKFVDTPDSVVPAKVKLKELVERPATMDDIVDAFARRAGESLVTILRRALQESLSEDTIRNQLKSLGFIEPIGEDQLRPKWNAIAIERGWPYFYDVLGRIGKVGGPKGAQYQRRLLDVAKAAEWDWIGEKTIPLVMGVI